MQISFQMENIFIYYILDILYIFISSALFLLLLHLQILHKCVKVRSILITYTKIWLLTYFYKWKYSVTYKQECTYFQELFRIHWYYRIPGTTLQFNLIRRGESYFFDREHTSCCTLAEIWCVNNRVAISRRYFVSRKLSRRNFRDLLRLALLFVSLNWLEPRIRP